MTSHPRPWKANAAIVGLGITEMGKIYGRSAADFAAEAIALRRISHRDEECTCCIQTDFKFMTLTEPLRQCKAIVGRRPKYRNAAPEATLTRDP